MSEAREKAFMVFGDVVLDTNLIAGVVGTTVWMETGQVLPVGYLAAKKVREWIDGLYEEGGEGGDPEEEPEETPGEDAGEAEADPPRARPEAERDGRRGGAMGAVAGAWHEHPGNRAARFAALRDGRPALERGAAGRPGRGIGEDVMNATVWLWFVAAVLFLVLVICLIAGAGK